MVLLDTHTYLWFIAGDERLSARGRQIIADPAAELRLSVASLWEIAIKYSLGKLPLARPFAEMFPEPLERDRIGLLHHRDPFDRLIVATALEEGLPVLSRDAAFSGYPVEVIWD